MDDTSSVASDKSSHRSEKKSPADDVQDPGEKWDVANEDITTTKYRVNVSLLKRELTVKD